MPFRVAKISLSAVVSLFCVCFAVAQPTPQQSLLVLSKQAHTLSIVDPSTMKVLAKAPVGPDPHEVIASADGKTAYVSIYGGGAYHTISVIDLVAQKALPDIDLGVLNAPHGLDYQAGKLWFTAEGAKVIGSYDPTTSKVDWIMGTGQNRTHMIYVTPGAEKLYTTNVSSATVSIWEKKAQAIRPPPPGPGGPNGQQGAPPPGQPPPGMGGPPRMEWNQTVIPVGPGDEGFDVSPDGHELWTANAQDGTISIINIDSKKVTATLPANVSSANRLKFTPDGRLVLVSMLGEGNLAIFDAATHKELKRIPVGHGAAGILIQPDGARAFIACTPDNYVAVLDLKSMQITSHIDAGGNPDGMAWVMQK